MMKKILYITILAGLFAVPSMAQNTENKLNNELQNKINILEEENKRLESDALNNKIWNDRAKYFNISYVKQSLSIEDANCTWNNKIGAALTWGRTYYLHKKPILGMIKFGIDWSFIDINFSMYEDKFGVLNGEGYYNEGNYYNPNEEYPEQSPSYGPNYEEDYEKEEAIKMYQADFGMQFGPSITINPINHLKLNGYFRVSPSYSILYDGEEVNGSYGTFFSVGGAISYKAISLGIEGRWGKAKYKLSEYNEEEESNGYYEEKEYTEATPKFKIGSTRLYISFRF